MKDYYDLIAIGSGQAAGPLCSAFVQAGQTALLVEREHVGGCCINEGCTPTKTLVASGRVAYLAGRAGDYGVNVPSVGIDMVRVRERKRAIVRSFREGSERHITGSGVDLAFGTASFLDARRVRVALNDGGTFEASARAIVIDTGGRPRPLSVPGAESVQILDSTSVQELDHVPEHLLVAGGGYIGLELGQLFRRLGSRVTIVHRGEHLLSREDEDVAQEMQRILSDDGIEVLLKADVSRVGPAPNGGVEATVKGTDTERTITGSHLLNAIGRMPNTDELNLDAAGIKPDKSGHIPVNDMLETSRPGIYAAGDVNGGPQFTHISYDDFRILRANLLEGRRLSRAGRLLPYVVFTDPELSRVGLTEQEARHSGREVRVASMPMSAVARALEMDEPRGLMKAVVDAETGELLGCALLGVFGGELMSLFEVAMMGKLPYTALRDGIFAHPTLAEAFNNLFARLT